MVVISLCNSSSSAAGNLRLTSHAAKSSSSLIKFWVSSSLPWYVLAFVFRLDLVDFRMATESLCSRVIVVPIKLPTWSLNGTGGGCDTSLSEEEKSLVGSTSVSAATWPKHDAASCALPSDFSDVGRATASVSVKTDGPLFEIRN